MADLIAIGYDDTTTAVQAMEEAERLPGDLIIEADAIAAIIRNQDGSSGRSRTSTRSEPAPSTACSGACCSAYCSSSRSSAWPSAPGIGALMGKVAKSGIDKQFQDQVRDMLQPGTSALFLVVEKVTPDKARRGAVEVRRHGAEVLAVRGRQERRYAGAARRGAIRLV